MTGGPMPVWTALQNDGPIKALKGLSDKGRKELFVETEAYESAGRFAKKIENRSSAAVRDVQIRTFTRLPPP